MSSLRWTHERCERAGSIGRQDPTISNHIGGWDRGKPSPDTFSSHDGPSPAGSQSKVARRASPSRPFVQRSLVNPTCAESGARNNKFNALNEKSALQFWCRGRLRLAASTGRSSSVRRKRLGRTMPSRSRSTTCVGLGDAAQAKFAMRGGREGDVMR